ncbi:MAG TPA: hypothetical protein VKU60_09920 [Chloroflexota bacterium]|nr:hypothetical protein [Chloroflexota bacterium]
MGQRADTLEREILASRERMGRTIDLVEQQFRRTMDWRTRVRDHPVPYAAGAAAVLYLLIGGPKRTAQLIRGARPRPKTKLEKLIEQLPDPLAERLAPPVHQAILNLQDVPEELRKTVREAQKERGKQVQHEEEQRLKRAARATMWERIAVKAAEAAGTAAAGLAVKMLTDRLTKEKDLSS